MIDVLNKLKEIENRSPEELNRAIGSITKLNAVTSTEKKVVETRATAMPDTSNGSYMIDVLNKLRELESRSPEVAHAISNATKMGSPVKEGIEIKTSGDDAILAQILKLAGMVNGVNSPDMAGGPGDIPNNGDEDMEMLRDIEANAGIENSMPEIPHDHAMAPLPSVGANLPSIDGGPEMDVDLGMDNEIPRGLNSNPSDMTMGGPKAAIEDDANRPYTNSPNEYTKGLKAAVPAGNDLAKTKATYPKIAGGDNPTHVAVSFD